MFEVSLGSLGQISIEKMKLDKLQNRTTAVFSFLLLLFHCLLYQVADDDDWDEFHRWHHLSDRILSPCSRRLLQPLPHHRHHR